ncbi:Transposon Ty3-G Gag-Pol polyprotein,Retrovirus-related Pol polyprotein from transposon opus,Retrovirus-related Pol polyprotein from transposon 297,Retrovirus-related Pol polyprotein from transposon 17.6,Transposon Ty3-I Gag-Pol polyprotein [Mytilus edulis]|uniref:RNA-directed DNA polymerase n=1 Tax=Mytilus edulis TaxID=6550 RepID=A0A8S3R3L3_MYTED|nr:Transposon Ty3-G Gag-Pol polyprotein,Retrovirus-related Pol polyprotein from transposon opus,Retrovirus-related Pol polyprotein from transposon 297,Retrovirus-related Pol polyprotein from transposon 17.6,Transposon Ty3-I Gag-Pol polyprotein [Mytilus edulis]
MRDATLLIDTGAVVSLVNKNMVPNIELLNVKPNYKHIVSATGQPLNITGILECEISVNSEVSVHNMYVVENLLYDAIIGTDIMKQIGIVIDMKDEAAYWNNMYVRFIGSSDQNSVASSSLYGVNLIQTVDIPARSEMICFGRVNGDVNGMIGIIEPKSQLTSKYSVIPARVLTKDTNIGTFEEINTVLDEGYDSDIVPTSNVVNSLCEGISEERMQDVQVDWDQLTKLEQGQLRELLNEFSDIFAKSDSDLGKTNLVSHSIDTQGHGAVKQRPYRVPFSQREEIRTQIQDMLDRDIIRPSHSCWASPVILVRKKDNTQRFCVDFRKLNTLTKKDVYPLPRIDDMVEAFRNSKYFSVMDVAQGYFQVPVDEKDKEKTAFVTAEGLYEFNCMPYGVCNGPSTFQRLMDLLLAGIQWKSALVYIDDLIVFSSSFDEHLCRLREVFGRLRNANLKLKKKKCAFMKSEVSFLGHIVSADGIKADPGKVEAVDKFPTPRNFTVITDHNPLRWLMTIKNPSGRLARWSLALQEYDLTIEYRAGKLHGNADGLSRRGETQNVVAGLTEISPAGLQLDVIKDLQIKDPNLRPIINYLKDGNLPEQITNARKVMACSPDYELFDGILHHFWTPGPRKRKHVRKQLVVPRSLTNEVMHWCHDDPTAGHLAFHKTYHKIQERFYWVGMYKDVDYWCKSCVKCATRKTPKGRKPAPMLPIPVDGPFDRVGVDVLGPFPPSLQGNRYIVVFTDYLTKWTEAFAVRNADAVTTSKLFVEEIVCRHSAPRTLLSDRGQNFMSNLLKEICKLVNTKKIFTTAYHPQCDGLVEKFNGVLTHMLSMFVDDHHKNWDVYIPYVLFAYRSSIQESTQETPFYLMYGRDARLPIDVALSEPTVTYTDADDYKANVLTRLQEAFTLAKDNIQLAQQKQKAYSDKKSAEPDYEIGQKVWVYSPASKVGLSHKLLHPWRGPHRIISKTSPVNFKIESCDNKKHQQILHANRIKPFLDPDDPPDAPNVFHDETDIQGIENPDQEDETIEDNDMETNVVVEVLDKLWTRNDEGRLEPKYFVKFENNTKENSWVKPDVIPGQLIEEFEENYKGRGASYRKKKV